MEEFTEKLFMATSSSGSETVTRVKVGGVRKWSTARGTEGKRRRGQSGNCLDKLFKSQTGWYIVFNAYCSNTLINLLRVLARVRVEVRKQPVDLCSPFYHVGPRD